MEVLVQAGTDLLRRIMAEVNPEKKKSIVDEVDALRIYVNDLLAKVHERLNPTRAFPPPVWNMVIEG